MYSFLFIKSQEKTYSQILRDFQLDKQISFKQKIYSNIIHIQLAKSIIKNFTYLLKKLS